MRPLSSNSVDLTVFVIANSFNLLVSVLFLARMRGNHRAERTAGLMAVALGPPLGACATLSLTAGRPWWMSVFPLLLAAHCAFELVLDYVLHVDWRVGPLKAPALILYYVGQMAMIGYSFGALKGLGFVTLATYLLSLVVSWYTLRAGDAHPQPTRGKEAWSRWPSHS